MGRIQPSLLTHPRTRLNKVYDTDPEAPVALIVCSSQRESVMERNVTAARALVIEPSRKLKRFFAIVGVLKYSKLQGKSSL